MTVSRLLALALQAELARRHSITLAEAECEALVGAIFRQADEAIAGRKRAARPEAEVIQLSERRP